MCVTFVIFCPWVPLWPPRLPPLSAPQVGVGRTHADTEVGITEALEILTLDLTQDKGKKDKVHGA